VGSTDDHHRFEARRSESARYAGRLAPAARELWTALHELWSAADELSSGAYGSRTATRDVPGMVSRPAAARDRAASTRGGRKTPCDRCLMTRSDPTHRRIVSRPAIRLFGATHRRLAARSCQLGAA